MNFENADGLEFDLTEDEIKQGVSFSWYPIFNDIYCSQEAIEYNEYLKSNPSD